MIFVDRTNHQFFNNTLVSRATASHYLPTHKPREGKTLFFVPDQAQRYRATK